MQRASRIMCAEALVLTISGSEDRSLAVPLLLVRTGFSEEDSPDLPLVWVPWPHVLHKPSHVSFENIPYLVRHTILIFSFSLNVKFLYGLFYPKMGNPHVARPCLQVKNGLGGVLWRNRILLTFSGTFLIGNYPGRYILPCSWNITVCRIYVRALFHSRLC